MKKLFFLAAMVTALFTGCTSDDMITEGTGYQGEKTANEGIGFNMKVANTTRADYNPAMQAHHYEFGVFAYGNDDATKTIMNNYLVAYTDGTAANFGGLYATLKNAASTYGNSGANGGTTDSRNGYSSWFYEGLANTAGAHTSYTTPDYKQILKYWDNSYATTNFYAYTPYATKGDAVEGNNPDKITYASGAFTYTALSSFYTTPVKKEDQTSDASYVNSYQVETANGGYAVADANKADKDKYNREIINYNEATYAAKEMVKGHYGEDVPLEFKHVNAKISVNIYSDVPGYKAQILDMVPEAIAKGTQETPDPKYAISKQNGIVLTPATQLQASRPMTMSQPAAADLSKYVSKADIVATGVTGTATMSMSGTPTQVNANLYFDVPEYVANDNTKNNGGQSPTWLYVLPNWTGSAYVENYPDDCKKTGYTLHVTYQLKPAVDDGSNAFVKVYDARVWIPADVCKWQAGKAYVYNIRITNATTGTTDPGNEEDPADNTKPYVDPTDPRVPTDAALTPIVFDGVTVVDYVDGTVDPADFEISSYEFHVDANNHYFVSANALLNGFAKQLGAIQDPTGILIGSAEATLNSVDAKGAWTYDATKKLFIFTSSFATDPYKNHTAYFAATENEGGTEATAYIWKDANGNSYKVVVTKSGSPAAWGTPKFETEEYDTGEKDANNDPVMGTRIKTYTSADKVEKAYAIYKHSN